MGGGVGGGGGEDDAGQEVGNKYRDLKCSSYHDDLSPIALKLFLYLPSPESC